MLALAGSERPGRPLARATPAVASSSRRTLPHIQLPQFAGAYEEWPAFRDLFKSLVDRDASLPAVEKLHYLKTSLKGEASLLVPNLPTTGENYGRAWTMLAEHYSNKRLLLRACFSAFTALPRMRSESVGDLRRVFHGMLLTGGALESIGRPISDCSDLFVHLVVELLDPRSRREWVTALGSTAEPPSVEDLRNFLECRVRALEALQPDKSDVGSPSLKKSPGTVPRTARSHMTQRRSEGTDRCTLCQGNHYVLFCDEFRRKMPIQKEFAGINKLCMNCFGKHQMKDCASKKSCAACQGRHHRSIHNACTAAVNAVATTSASLHAGRTEGETAAVLLATARVYVMYRYGNLIPVRALVDSGSEVSLVAEALAQRLRLPRVLASTTIVGVGGKQTGVARGRVALRLSSSVGDFSLRVSALILPRISTYGSRVNSANHAWPHLDGLSLADPDFRSADRVELLLGADVFASIVQDGLRKGGQGSPIAQRTSLGWIVSGVIAGSNPGDIVASLQCSAGDELAALVLQFWDQEEPPRAPLPLTADEQSCEEHFVLTRSRLADGRYMVRLPVKPAMSDLFDSRRVVLRVLNSVERRCRAKPEHKMLYDAFMLEYEELRHMTRVPSFAGTNTARLCYLPHHGVLKTSAESAKIRVVFNGSARLYSGDSLNSCLLTGPNLLPALADVLLRWRLHRFSMIADIEKMYRQVSVHPCDRDLQRILWRSGDDATIQEFQLNTVTYGLTCAPFLAIRSLHQLAMDEGHRFPRGAAVLRRDTYLDDVLTGADTIEEAREIQQDLVNLCATGCFPLRKWAANDDALLAGVPLEHQQRQSLHTWRPESGHSTLGLQWHPRDDAFSFRVQATVLESITKRAFLSQTARLFDPLGWLAPVIVGAKLLIQSAWMQRVDWDQPLSIADGDAWRGLLEELPLLEGLRIPRWLRTERAAHQLEIHGFADASERAYAAVTYLRVCVEGRSPAISLLQAKTKVAPIQRVSVPRLELCAAALLTKLVAHVRSSLGLTDARIHLWSDSMVALAWIRGHPSRWMTYVANRVAEIQRALPDATWHHIPGQSNPADCASRGLSPRELISFSLWWQGPTWLRDDAYQPTALLSDNEEEEVPERRARVNVANAAPDEDELLMRYSTLHRLQCVTAWCRRWLRARRAQSSHSSFSGVTLAPQELEEALALWIRKAQISWYARELRVMARDAPLPRGSDIRTLHPFIDDHGVVRVGGRLKHALLSYDERHPVILPRAAQLTSLIVAACHRRTLHGGVQLTLGLLRQRF